MLIKQTLNSSITIQRFDTGEDVSFEQDQAVEVDDTTGEYLLAMKCFNENGELLSNFIRIS